MKAQNDKDIEEFQIILKQVYPNNHTIINEIKDTKNEIENNKTNIFGVLNQIYILINFYQKIMKLLT